MPTAHSAAPITLAVKNVRLRHPARAREDRHDRPDERNEAREHDRARAAPLEERVRPFEVLGLEEAGVGLEQAGAEAAADPVADLRAERPRRGTNR